MQIRIKKNPHSTITSPFMFQSVLIATLLLLKIAIQLFLTIILIQFKAALQTKIQII